LTVDILWWEAGRSFNLFVKTKEGTASFAS